MYIQTIININAEKHSPDKLVLMLQWYTPSLKMSVCCC